MVTNRQLKDKVPSDEDTSLQFPTFITVVMLNALYPEELSSTSFPNVSNLNEALDNNQILTRQKGNLDYLLYIITM